MWLENVKGPRSLDTWSAETVVTADVGAYERASDWWGVGTPPEIQRKALISWRLIRANIMKHFTANAQAVWQNWSQFSQESTRDREINLKGYSFYIRCVWRHEVCRWWDFEQNDVRHCWTLTNFTLKEWQSKKALLNIQKAGFFHVAMVTIHLYQQCYRQCCVSLSDMHKEEKMTEKKKNSDTR